jgi:dihydrofolate reductase
VHGSGALTRWLLENDLVDEITLITVPVILTQVRRQVAHGISVRQIHRLAPKLPQRQT